MKKIRSMTTVSCICWVPMLLSTDMRTWMSNGFGDQVVLNCSMRNQRVCQCQKMIKMLLLVARHLETNLHLHLHQSFWCYRLVVPPTNYDDAFGVSTRNWWPKAEFSTTVRRKEDQPWSHGLKVSHGWMKSCENPKTLCLFNEKQQQHQLPCRDLKLLLACYLHDPFSTWWAIKALPQTKCFFKL